MLAPENEVDADFFTSLHRAAPSARPLADGPLNRRDCSRRPFHSVQRIAPRRGPGVPAESDFFEVPCYDLTQRGFSFLIPARPEFDSLVAEFDIPPAKVYIAAEVVRCTRVLVYPPDTQQPLGSWSLQRNSGAGAENGVPRILVGCRFAERLQRNA